LYSKKCTKISDFTKKIYFPLFSAVLHHFQAYFFAIPYKKYSLAIPAMTRE